MTLTVIATTLLALQAAPAAPANPADAAATQEAEAKTDPNIDVVEKKPVKDKKITDRSHPDYVRCKSEAVMGSRAKRRRTCMTNRQWELAARRGNEESRDLVDGNRDGFMSGQGGLGGG